MAHLCPACGWPHLVEPPRTPGGGGSYEICSSCGFQPGVTDDDEGHSPEAWRTLWIQKGMPWSSAALRAPRHWDPAKQLRKLAGESGVED